MAYNKDKKYDPDLDYSEALSSPDLSDADRTRLTAERQYKINDMYGGSEPLYKDTGKTYSLLYGNNGMGGQNSKNYDYNTDYHQKALDYAGAGDLQSAYDALFAPQNSREAKIAGTGENYGETSQQIWDRIRGASSPTDIDALRKRYEEMYAESRNNPRTPYQNGWGENTYRDMLERVMSMNYEDWTQSDAYKSLADRYGEQGQRAMQDVLAQLSARTGGLASSYATGAAASQYNEYMKSLEDAARNLYANERGDYIENAGLARNYGDMEYNRWMDAQNLGIEDRNYQRSMLNDLLGYAYDTDDIAYSRGLTEQRDLQARIANAIEGGAGLADLDPDMVARSGLTTAELEAMLRRAQPVYATGSGGGGYYGGGGYSGGGYSGGGSGSGSDSGGGLRMSDFTSAGNGDYYGLFKNAEMSGNPKAYIDANYADYGYSDDDIANLSGDYDTWKSAGGGRVSTGSGSGSGSSNSGSQVSSNPKDYNVGSENWKQAMYNSGIRDYGTALDWLLNNTKHDKESRMDYAKKFETWVNENYGTGTDEPETSAPTQGNYSDLFLEAYKSGYPEAYIANNYSDYGFNDEKSLQSAYKEGQQGAVRLYTSGKQMFNSGKKPEEVLNWILDNAHDEFQRDGALIMLSALNTSFGDYLKEKGFGS